MAKWNGIINLISVNDETNDTDVTGSLIVTGSIIATNISASGDITGSNLFISNTATASSALIQNTFQFQTQSSPPSAIAGTLYIDSDYNLFIAQD